ncbi:MAG: biopolymer transporter ExbD [Leptospirales bacterium]|nr:biopolymer transporter ExbD [Leptospirales bacterium]
MAAGPSQSDDGEISGINVVPLIDIMLVIVIILMITAEFTKYRTIPIKLPNINAASVRQEPQKVNITVHPDGRLFWNDRPIDPATLPALLRAQKQIQPDLAVIMRAEGATSYQSVLSVLDTVKEAGIVKVGLAVDSNRPGRR